MEPIRENQYGSTRTLATPTEVKGGQTDRRRGVKNGTASERREVEDSGS